VLVRRSRLRRVCNVGSTQVFCPLLLATRCSAAFYRHRPSVRPSVCRTGVLRPCLGRHDRARPLHSTATLLTRRASSERPASLRARPSIDSRCRQLVTRGVVAVLLLTGSFLRPYLTMPDAAARVRRVHGVPLSTRRVARYSPTRNR